MSKRDDIREAKARAEAEKAAKAMNSSQEQLKIQENKQTEDKKTRKKKEEERKQEEAQKSDNSLKEEIPTSNEPQNIETAEMPADFSDSNPVQLDSENINGLLESENVDVSSLFDSEKAFLGKLAIDKNDYGNDYDIKKMADMLVNSNGEDRDNTLTLLDKANDIKIFDEDHKITEESKNDYNKIVDMICDKLIDNPKDIDLINSYDKDIKHNFIDSINKDKGLEQQMPELTQTFNKVIDTIEKVVEPTLGETINLAADSAKDFNKDIATPERNTPEIDEQTL